MATKTDMITFILENSEEFTQEELSILSYKEIKKIFDATDSKEIGDQYAETEIPKEILDNLKLVSSENYGDDGIALSSEQIDDLIFEDKEEKEFQQDAEDLDVLKEVVEEVEWNYDDLSPNDKRLYKRTGIKRISKNNKYTRFGKEQPKL